MTQTKLPPENPGRFTPSLHRHYPVSSVLRPLRHPTAPVPSLAGVRLLVPEHVMGFPCCVRFPCVHAAATTPVQQAGSNVAQTHPPISAFPALLDGSACTSTFRGLLSVHSRCGLHTRTVTYVTVIRGLQTLRHLHACPGCFRLEQFAGWDPHPLEKRRLCTAHTKPGHLAVPSISRDIVASSTPSRAATVRCVSPAASRCSASPCW